MGAARFLLDRIATTILVLLGATILLFALTLFIPGNPAQVLLGPRATPQDIAQFTQAMGLDRPVWERLLIFLGHVARGDFGTDVVSGRPILAMVLDVLPYTLVLTIASIGLAVLIGVPLGCVAAFRPGGVVDRVIGLGAVGFIAIPNFVIAIVLLLVFSTWLHWLPVLGVGRSGGLVSARLILPACSLALPWVGYIARLLRASLLEVLAEQHVRTARAYGVGERRILGRYALRLASLPLVALLGVGVGQMLGGAIFAEIVFARPGIGTLMFDAIGNRNFPVVQAAVLIVVALFVLANLLADALQARLDPRVAERERGA
jgi:peptide/nickel transport system permease protein